MPEGWLMAGGAVVEVDLYSAVLCVAGAASSVVMYGGVKEVEDGIVAAAAEIVGYEGDVFIGYASAYVY